MKTTTVGLDLAKTVFQVHGVDRHGRMVLTRQLRRKQVAGFFARLGPCLIGMEATAGAHYWARVLNGLGHEVKLCVMQFAFAKIRKYVNT